MIVALLSIAIAYLAFEFGRIRAGYNIADAAAERTDYERRIEDLESNTAALKEEIALLETHWDIDGKSYKEVEGSLAALQAKIQEQTDEIAFYRGIVSPADGNAGLRVQELKLTRGKAEREYNLRLVLVQAMKHDRKVSGNVVVSVEGNQNGSEKTYSYSELLPPDAEKAWAFSFRYFQDFNRPLVLPDGFTPQRIKVNVESRTRSIASIEESFSWATNQG